MLIKIVEALLLAIAWVGVAKAVFPSDNMLVLNVLGGSEFAHNAFLHSAAYDALTDGWFLGGNANRPSFPKKGMIGYKKSIGFNDPLVFDWLYFYPTNSWNVFGTYVTQEAAPAVNDRLGVVIKRVELSDGTSSWIGIDTIKMSDQTFMFSTYLQGGGIAEILDSHTQTEWSTSQSVVIHSGDKITVYLTGKKTNNRLGLNRVTFDHSAMTIEGGRDEFKSRSDLLHSRITDTQLALIDN